LTSFLLLFSLASSPVVVYFPLLSPFSVPLIIIAFIRFRLSVFLFFFLFRRVIIPPRLKGKSRSISNAATMARFFFFSRRWFEQYFSFSLSLLPT